MVASLNFTLQSVFFSSSATNWDNLILVMELQFMLAMLTKKFLPACIFSSALKRILNSSSHSTMITPRSTGLDMMVAPVTLSTNNMYHESWMKIRVTSPVRKKSSRKSSVAMHSDVAQIEAHGSKWLFQILTEFNSYRIEMKYYKAYRSVNLPMLQ